MAGPKRWTEELIAKRYEEGRGQGSGENYSPWIRVQEFSSKGNQTRVPSRILKRTIHTFSYVERAMYLFLEYTTDLIDYREQFAIDRRVTLGAAKSLGIRHPVYPKTKVPLVMMLDALVTLMDGTGAERLVAWDAKPADKLGRRRIREKLSLHRAYCVYVGIEHNLFDETTVSRNVVRNIELIRAALPRDGEQSSAPALQGPLGELLRQGLAADKRRIPVWVACKQFDIAHHLDAGSSLTAFYRFVWNRTLTVPLDVEHLELTPVAKVALGAGRRRGH